MSSYLGIEPTKRPDYYFVSYNNEDAVRLSPLMQQLVHYNIPLWYDYGLEYGEQWQKEIADRIQGCQAVLLFITKGILEKAKSYVTIEYEMATQYFDKTVYVILVDDIRKEDVPNSLLGWWIDVTHKQSLSVSQYKMADKLMEEFKKMLKISSLEERIETIMEQYAALTQAGENAKAEQLLSAVLHGKELETKAEIMSRFYTDGYAGLKATYTVEGSRRSNVIEEFTFEALSRTVFRRGGAGDADVIDITRNGECIFTIGGLVDAYSGELFYDADEELLYVMYFSYPNVPGVHEDADTKYLSICIVERPCDEAICHDYRHKMLKKYSLI